MSYKFARSGELLPMTAEELAEADKDSFVVVCDQGTDVSGKPYWLFIAVKPSKYKEFMKGHTPINFEEYGDVLLYGYDKEVPASAKQKMIDKYNWDDNFMTTVRQDVEKARAAYLKEEDARDTARFQDIAAMLKNKQ